MQHNPFPPAALDYAANDIPVAPLVNIPPIHITEAEESAYGRAALKRAHHIVANAMPGKILETLKAQVYYLGQLCAGGELSSKSVSYSFNKLGLKRASEDKSLNVDSVGSAITIALQNSAEFPRSPRSLEEIGYTHWGWRKITWPEITPLEASE